MKIRKMAPMIRSIVVVEIAEADERGSAAPWLETVTSKRCMPFDVTCVSSMVASSWASKADLDEERPILTLVGKCFGNSPIILCFRREVCTVVDSLFV